MSEIAKKLEAILFVSGEPIGLDRLSKILKQEKDKIKTGLEELGGELEGRGLRLIEKDDSFMLGTPPELGDLVQDYMKDELGEDLSRATLETLAVIVYKGPITRAQIDYIRGVNSNFTVRNLMIRRIIERKADPKDSRSWLYSPSFEFLKFAGIEKLDKLAGYNEFKKEMDELLKREEKIEEAQ